ncbi:MAG: TolC family protein [Rhodospirillales bacterium]|nr:TolC family protein [Rhodospirillales bacterium]
MQTHPLVASTNAERRAAERRTEEVEAELLPSLDLTADSGYQHAHRPNSTTIDEDLWRNKQRLALSQLVYDGDGTTNRVNSSRATAKSADFDVRSAAIRIAQRAIRAYLDVARDRKLVEYALDNVDLHQRILADVEEAARTGGGSGARVAQVRTRLFNAQSQRRRAEGNLKNSTSEFLEAVGQMPGTLHDLPAPTMPIPVSIEAARDEALKHSPVFRAAIETEKARSLTAESERGAFFPTVELEVAHEMRDGVDGESGFESDSTALLRFSWNLYRGGGDDAAVRRALEQSSAAMFRIHEVERQIRKELEISMTDYEVAGDQVTLLRDRVTTAEEVTAAYREQFRLGQRTLVELLDSGNEYFLARSDLTTVEYQRIGVAYDLLAIKGTLLEDLGVRIAEGKPAMAR